MLQEEILATQKYETPFPGITTWRNVQNGFAVIDLEFTADPSKRSEEWLLQERTGMPRAQFNREYGKTWTTYDGKPVYGDFDDSGPHVMHGTIIVPKMSRLVSGWDGGPNDVNLAWALGVAIPSEAAIFFIDEVYVDDGDIYSFVEIVAARLRLEWLKLGGFSIHVADQSVFTKSGVVQGGKAMADVMRQYGMAPIPGEISFAKRRASVERMMSTTFKWNKGISVPKLRIHERCEFLRESLRGGYAYPKMAGGVGGDYKPMPMKNRYSHIANAMEYACSRMSLMSMDIPYEGQRLPEMASSY